MDAFFNEFGKLCVNVWVKVDHRIFKTVIDESLVEAAVVIV